MARDRKPLVIALNRFAIWRARAAQRAISSTRRSDSARLCQSRAEPPQWRAARGARTVIDPGIGERGVCVSAGGPTRARRRGENPARLRRRRAAIGGHQGAKDRNLSLDSIAMDMSGKEAAMKGKVKRQRHRSDGANRNPCRPNAAHATRQNRRSRPTIIQKTYRTEAVARMHTFHVPPIRDSIERSGGCSGPNHFCDLRQQGRAGADLAGSFGARRRSAPQCRNHPQTCSKRSSSIRRCCFFSTTSIAGPEFRAGQNRSAA